MFGITQGETSSTSNPLIVAYFRHGGVLVDPATVTYQVDRINDPASSLVTEVAATSLDLTTTRLGLGRYAIPVDATSFELGTHRVVLRATHTFSGSMEHVSTLEFEVLDPAEYPSGQGYQTYISTRELYKRGLATFAAAPPSTYHDIIMGVSQQLEGLLRQPLEPRYAALRVDGGRIRTATKLLLPMTIIALEGVYEVTFETDGTETFDATSATNTKVFNRHLDSGPDWADDRDNPRLWLGDGIYQGQRAYDIRGVFGYTDPTPGLNNFRVSLGRTPRDLIDVAMALTTRAVEDATFSSFSTHAPGSTKSYKTRHQRIEFFNTSGGGSSSAGGLLGDVVLDTKLARMQAPSRLDWIDRRAMDESVGTTTDYDVLGVLL